MTATRIHLPTLRLIGSQARSFPDDIKGSFQRLEGRMPSLKGRRFYGLTFKRGNSFDYFAAVEPESDEEITRLGLPIIEVNSGAWIRAKLMDWPANTDKIGPTIDSLIDEYGIDGARPTIEFYRSQYELHLLVPVE